MLKTIVVMGVSGSGKSLIGKKLAEALRGTFEDADDFHPPANIDKMSKGFALTDGDRWPWLHVLRERIVSHQSNLGCYVLACSALKQSYRDLLRGGDSPEALRFVYLMGTKKVLLERIERRDHFMPSSLLDSQLATLEEPEDAIAINVELEPDTIISAILGALATAESAL
jgi:gluconokinase